MKHIRRFGYALMGLSVATGILLACGDDDAVELATTDAGADQASPVDSDVQDSGVEVNLDAQADVILVPVDSGDPNADAGQLAQEFPGRVADAICKTTARCCFGNENTAGDAGVDGGFYNEGKCLSIHLPTGLDDSNPSLTVDFSKVTYNAARATECLSRIEVLACGANAAEYDAAVQACYAALAGTGVAGSPCRESAECGTNFFCNTSLDGGSANTGACEAIRATGALCGDWTSNAAASQETCSNRFSGAPPRFCENTDDNGVALPVAEWKCADARALNSSCNDNAWCNNGVCPATGSTAFTCQGFITLFNQISCNAYISH